ncbi:Uncharacterized protein Rs2_16061 [Raphanus sativus]|nr:Uncharacterized protein Rs2_16061 [Raphanus sativus]
MAENERVLTISHKPRERDIDRHTLRAIDRHSSPTSIQGNQKTMQELHICYLQWLSKYSFPPSAPSKNQQSIERHHAASIDSDPKVSQSTIGRITTTNRMIKSTLLSLQDDMVHSVMSMKKTIERKK